MILHIKFLFLHRNIKWKNIIHNTCIYISYLELKFELDICKCKYFRCSPVVGCCFTKSFIPSTWLDWTSSSSAPPRCVEAHASQGAFSSEENPFIPRSIVTSVKMQAPLLPPCCTLKPQFPLPLFYLVCKLHDLCLLGNLCIETLTKGPGACLNSLGVMLQINKDATVFPQFV